MPTPIRQILQYQAMRTIREIPRTWNVRFGSEAGTNREPRKSLALQNKRLQSRLGKVGPGDTPSRTGPDHDHVGTLFGRGHGRHLSGGAKSPVDPILKRSAVNILTEYNQTILNCPEKPASSQMVIFRQVDPGAQFPEKKLLFLNILKRRGQQCFNCEKTAFGGDMFH